MEGTLKQLLSFLVPWSVTFGKLPFSVWLFTFFELRSRNAGNTNNAFATTSWLITRTTLVQTKTRGIGKDGLAAIAKKGDISAVIEQIFVCIHNLSKVRRTDTTGTTG